MDCKTLQDQRSDHLATLKGLRCLRFSFFTYSFLHTAQFDQFTLAHSGLFLKDICEQE